MDPQSNGHAQNAPQQPQAHPQAQAQAMQARIGKLRQDVADAEQVTDNVNALYLTEQAEKLALMQENSQLKGQVADLQHQLERRDDGPAEPGETNTDVPADLVPPGVAGN